MFEKIKINSNWNNWQWQYKNSFCTIEEIKKYINIDKIEPNTFKNTGYTPISVTPYMLYTITNMDAENANSLLKQFIPFAEHSKYKFSEIDSLKENKACVAPNLIRKHRNRVALLVNRCCACYCQFCTRQHITRYHKNKKHHIKSALDYIHKNEEISDILITGGDPLLEETVSIDSLLHKLYSISHIRIIRIGTRIPITMPMRINSELINILCKYPTLYINIHINHPAEITAQSKAAILSLANAGIPLGGQSVLLRGINNSVEILQKLFEQMIEIKVKPYYLYQCDKAPGCEKFIVSPTEGIKIINELNGRLSGFAVPKFVVDTPKAGKLVAGPTNTLYSKDHGILFSDHDGKSFWYEI